MSIEEIIATRDAIIAMQKECENSLNQSNENLVKINKNISSIDTGMTDLTDKTNSIDAININVGLGLHLLELIRKLKTILSDVTDALKTAECLLETAIAERKRKHDNENEIANKKQNIIRGLNFETGEWHCLVCGESMGESNPRQLCGKTSCVNA